MITTLEDHERWRETERSGGEGEGRHEWLQVEVEHLEQRLDDLFDQALAEHELRDRGGEGREPISQPFDSGTVEPPTMSERKIMSEGEVEQALRLFAGRQLCDRIDLETADSLAYVFDHEVGLVEAMAEAVYAYHQADPGESDGGEDGA